jgi:hypothetical protein
MERVVVQIKVYRDDLDSPTMTFALYLDIGETVWMRDLSMSGCLFSVS